MPQLINTSKEIIRINSGKNSIEASTTQGRSWITRFSGSSCGIFIDLLIFDNGIIAATSRGIYYSSTEGHSWIARYTGSSCGTFQSLMDNGRELLAQTSNGLYYSTTQARSWIKRQ